ncbi:helix-turn-helix domain-containing protein [uncultured Roseovarius sp.]|uniref:helix-turn-helix domain-containing protein n=1 Tax=uncultured Roseovarius sp. TaxID=293344 RepID=UPI0026236F69|nr:helix-turn-helix domain-containing protein [uncultured Roseovarius sp.]
MRTGISFTVSDKDQSRLEAVISQPSSPQRHVWRCRIVLLSGEGLGPTAIMATTGTSTTCVWRWQERYMSEGVEELEFPRFDGHFSLDEGECFSCRERGPRTRRTSGSRWLRWLEPGAVLKAWRASTSPALRRSTSGSGKGLHRAASARPI